MNLDLLRYKKNSVTASPVDVNTSWTGLQTIHQAIDITDRHLTSNGIWGAVDGEAAWIKLNTYEVQDLQQMTISWSGSVTNMKVEISIDNFNWTEITPAFVPTNDFIDIDYSSEDGHFIFLRLTVTDPLNFLLLDWEIFGDINYNIDYILSHNYLNMYSKKELEDTPLFPEFTKVAFQMMEGFTSINKQLFDPTIFSSSSITPTINGTLLTLTPNNIPVITDTRYIWDFDEVILEADPDYVAVNKNIIIATDVTIAQTYDYKKVGIHMPRLIVDNPNWSVEFVETFTR